MPKAVPVALLLLLVALAGCSGQPGQQDETGEGDGDGPRTAGDGRSSDSGNETSEDPPHDTVTLLDETIDLIGEASLTFDVTVPANVTNVDFSITYGTASAVFNDLRIELSGCGAYSTGGANIGTVNLSGRVCKDATSGAATVTVTNTGFVQGGNLRLEGQVPRPASNDTASA